MPSSAVVCLAFLTLGVLVLRAQGLLCYVCTMTGEAEKDLCLNAPGQLPGSVVTCQPHHKACLTMRIEHKDSGRIKSFSRSCSLPGKDVVKSNENYVFIHRYCSTNKCNKGDGKGSDNCDQNKRITAILVKDISNAGPRTHFPSIIFLSLPLVKLLL